MSVDLKFHHKIHSYIVPLCQPDPSTTTDPIKGLYINSLNFYTLIFLELSNVLVLAFHTPHTWSSFLLFSGLIASMMASLLLTCRSQPGIYKFTNAIILTLAGPATVYVPETNIFFGMTFSLIAPSIILILFQKKLLAYLSFITEYIFLNLLYLPLYQKYMKSAASKDPEYIAYQLFNSFNLIFIFNALLLYTTFSMTQGSSSSTMADHSATVSQNPSSNKFAGHAETFLSQVLSSINLALIEENVARSKIYLTKAKAYGDILLSKARNILDVERGENIDVKSSPLPTKVTDFLEKIWSTSSEAIKRKGLFGTITLHRMMPPIIMLDQQKLVQVILSVVANAVRFTEKGDIDLSFSWIDGDVITNTTFEPIPYDEGEGIGEGGGIGQAKTRTLGRGCNIRGEGESVYVFNTNERRISTENLANNQQQSAPRRGILKITITDTGSGIAQKDSAGLLNLFIKGIQNKKTPQFRKSNMWMVDQLCQKMNGHARFYSKPGEGVTCILCIKTEVPNSEMLEQNPILAELNGMPSSQRRMKGILFDDNLYTSDTTKTYLEKCSIDVLHIVRNREELVEAYEREVRQGRAIQIVTLNARGQLADIKSIYDRIRTFETGRRLNPCTIVLFSEAYTEPQLRACVDPLQNSKENIYMRLPIHLPDLQKALSSMNSNGLQEARENFHPKKIFVVNDDTFNLDLITRMLSMHGFDSVQATNGEIAVDKYKKEWRDIAAIFMDCQMPVMDGYEATRQIRRFQQSSKIPKIKIWGVSGNLGAAHDERCREAGMDDTIALPFTADKVKKVATECVAEYQ